MSSKPLVDTLASYRAGTPFLAIYLMGDPAKRIQAAALAGFFGSYDPKDDCLAYHTERTPVKGTIDASVIGPPTHIFGLNETSHTVKNNVARLFFAREFGPDSFGELTQGAPYIFHYTSGYGSKTSQSSIIGFYDRAEGDSLFFHRAAAISAQDNRFEGEDFRLNVTAARELIDGKELAKRIAHATSSMNSKLLEPI